MFVQVFLAEAGAGAFERTFAATSEFIFAARIDVAELKIAPADRREELMAIAEVVFDICNSYPTEMHSPSQYLDQVRAYRAGCNRSLSMGDVICIGEAFYFCASTGWEPIATPSTNLINAFIAANAHIVRSS